MGWVFGGARAGVTRFSIYDKIACKSCGGDARISRRTPHPEWGAGFELHTFTC